ncbi:immunoglobulin-like domain-containing protein [Shewanella subflava]|uniref:immunoglobulin-like domain-containing protein n=1 Tax=Shewanella subflava TaxID=2986476 RepID=UPI0029D4199A|nr:immunoglobulin-like domain-containing protein [Shewanella subflava]
MFAKNKLAAVIGVAFSALSMQVQAAPIVNPEAGVVVGYWHNWCDGAGYKGGVAPCVDLAAVHPMYNVVNVSFMKVFNTADGRIPTFKLDPTIGLSEGEFTAQIAELNQQGRSVLLALGGADAHVEMLNGDEDAFAAEIIRLTDLYGFDGLDIDLEQAAITAADNQTVIPAALRMVKDHYRTEGKNFLITMAPEFPYLTQNGHYVPYLRGLEGYYDWVNPQFYNQGGDGLWIDGVGWIAQNNDNLKEEFIYYISDSLINGTRGYYKIPHNKLVFGLPTNNDAAATGFVSQPQALFNAFDALKAQSQPLRGVMTWSVNWDMGRSASGQQYNEAFVKTYGPYIHSQELPPIIPEDGKPFFTGLTDARVKHNNHFDPLLGVEAHDAEDGDLTSKITVEGDVDTSRLGLYPLTYSVIDSDDNATKQVRTIEVYSEKPVFEGVEAVTVQQFSDFDPLAGVTAIDAEDGDLTSSIVVEGHVDTQKVGKYALTYQVSDSANQTSRINRAVTVVPENGECEVDNLWSATQVYTGGEQVTHGDKIWQASWWTRAEEPGTTGEWGVWKVKGDSECDNQQPPVPGPVDPTITVSGVSTQYIINDGAVAFDVNVQTNTEILVHVKLYNSEGLTYSYFSDIVDNQSQTIPVESYNVDAGSYQLHVYGTIKDSHELVSEQQFTVKLVESNSEYPEYVPGQQYAAGDIVSFDGGLYQCKPWPYSGWCSNSAYAPSGQYWQDAWTKQ